VFGQLTIPLGDKFEFLGGLRYTDEKRDWQGATFIGTFANLDEAYASGAPRLSQLPIPVGDPGHGGPLDFPTSLSKDKVDYQATLKFKPNDDSMYYLSVSEAFRSGGYSSGGTLLAGSARAVRPETLTSIEAGLKLSLADNRVRFNAAAFYYDYKDFQATVRARHRGQRAAAECRDVHIKARAVVRLAALAGSLDRPGAEPARLRDRRDRRRAAAARRRTDLDIKGNEIPNAPNYSVSGRLRYETPISDTLAAAFPDGFRPC
jgi:iron complex outermembrane receptor protein